MVLVLTFSVHLDYHMHDEEEHAILPVSSMSRLTSHHPVAAQILPCLFKQVLVLVMACVVVRRSQHQLIVERPD